MSDRDSERISRRRLLGGAAATAGALALPSPAAAQAGRRRRAIPFHGAHQAGIAQPRQRHAAFAAFDAVAPDRESLARLLRGWSEVAAALARGRTAPPGDGRGRQSPPDSAVADGLGPAGLTVTFGFGPGLFGDRYGLGAQRPERLRTLPRFEGDRLQGRWCGGDLLVQICADDRQVVSHALRELRGRAAGLARPRWAQDGFSSPPRGGGAPRNLLGFHDGTGNPGPAGRRFEESVWVGDDDGPTWLAGGSYLVFRKVQLLLGRWDAAGPRRQDVTIGRLRDSGAPLPRMPASAHVRRARGFTVVRRSFNYDYGLREEDGELDAGLLFCAFVRDPAEQFVALQRRLAAADRLNAFAQHTGSAIFAIPPGCRPGGYVGDRLLGRQS